MQTMKLVEYKHLLVSLENKKLRELEEELKEKIKFLIDKSNHSIKSKCLKWIVKKNTARLQKISGIRNEETKPKYAEKIISY